MAPEAFDHKAGADRKPAWKINHFTAHATLPHTHATSEHLRPREVPIPWQKRGHINFLWIAVDGANPTKTSTMEVRAVIFSIHSPDTN
jgi:hypothetical protein